MSAAYYEGYRSGNADALLGRKSRLHQGEPSQNEYWKQYAEGYIRGWHETRRGC